MEIVYAFIAVIAVSLVSLIGILTLSWQEGFLRKCLLLLVSLAVGALLGDAIIHLIPEAFAESASTTTAALWVLVGMLLFFSIEKFLHWHHHHSTHTQSEMEGNHTHEAHRHLGALIFTADGLHNFIDGVIIAASFFISPGVGVATTLAVFLHEIPQEIGDFAILIHAGFSKAQALLINFSSALLAVVGVFFVLLFESSSEQFLPVVTAIAAGSFLYIAGSDLVPELQKSNRTKDSLMQLVAVIIGITLMWGLIFIEVGAEAGHGHAPEAHGHENRVH